MNSNPGTPPLAVVVMAAGKGTRMRDPDRAKVMFPVGGRPMIDHVVRQATEAGAERIIAIVGHRREVVRAYLDEVFGERVEIAEQVEQLGTGHAVMQAAPLLVGFEGNVLVLSGDVPLLSAETLRHLITLHHSEKAAATLLTATAPDPTGYGRVLRDASGAVGAIREHRDASENELAVDEINAGIYLFRADALLEGLRALRSDNAQNEYYLTDIIGWLVARNERVAAWRTPDIVEVQGINTVEQLAEIETLYQERAVRTTDAQE